jgi:hypothetical protein
MEQFRALELCNEKPTMPGTSEIDCHRKGKILKHKIDVAPEGTFEGAREGELRRGSQN